MDRKSFSAVLDEAVGQLDGEVRVLKNLKATLSTNVKELEVKKDILSQEIIDFTSRLDGIKKSAKEESDKILGMAQDKLNKASLLESQANFKVLELNEKIKEAENLIKSNQGKEKNLIFMEHDIKIKTNKMIELVNLIGETIEKL